MERASQWGLARVGGRSMLPTLRDGDRLLVAYGARVRPGDLVVARFPDGTIAVKRAQEQRHRGSGTAGSGAAGSGSVGWWLVSDNPDEGVDSRHRGPVAEEAVLAVVRLRVWPSPRMGRALTPR